MVELLPIDYSNGFAKLEPIFSNQNMQCLLVTETPSSAIKYIEETYLLYLRKEVCGEDCPTYRDTKDKKEEIFLVLNSEHTACIGIFVFEKADRTEFFQKVKANYLNYLEAKSLTEDKAPEVFQEKIKRNTGKNNSKTIYYTHLNFFAHAKSYLNSDKHNLDILMAAWVHPSYRRQGILTNLWPYFQKRYGLFEIDSPSEAMQNFIAKQKMCEISLCSNSIVV